MTTKMFIPNKGTGKAKPKEKRLYVVTGDFVNGNYIHPSYVMSLFRLKMFQCYLVYYKSQLEEVKRLKDELYWVCPRKNGLYTLPEQMVSIDYILQNMVECPTEPKAVDIPSSWDGKLHGEVRSYGGR